MQNTKKYIETGLRWFGRNDSLGLENLKQAGADFIVSALHEVDVGDVWEVAQIKAYQAQMAKHKLLWKVVESLPVHEAIKHQGPGFENYIENYKQSMINLAQCGIKTITYNFMPVLDWVRTNHHFQNEDGTHTLQFDPVAMAYFDCYILKREGAKDSYKANLLAQLEHFHEAHSETEKKQLKDYVLLGLPGSSEDFSLSDLKKLMAPYHSLTKKDLRQNLIDFLEEIIPVAQAHKLQMAIHPDDPPFSVLGLPRIVSTADDLAALFEAVPAPENGLCFCSGSLGADPNNDLNLILNTHKERVHFLHLRDVHCLPDGSFQEANHLSGDHNMRTLVQTTLALAQERNITLPLRPDHGFLHAFESHKKYYPGYSLLGRMQGLSALKGLIYGLS